MPLYHYICEECSHLTEDVCSFSEKQDDVACEKCGSTTYESFKRNDKGNAENPRESLAMGVHPSQIEIAQKKWPGSRYNPETGRLKIRNRAEKKVRLRQRGWIE